VKCIAGGARIVHPLDPVQLGSVLCFASEGLLGVRKLWPDPLRAIFPCRRSHLPRNPVIQQDCVPHDAPERVRHQKCGAERAASASLPPGPPQRERYWQRGGERAVTAFPRHGSPTYVQRAHQGVWRAVSEFQRRGIRQRVRSQQRGTERAASESPSPALPCCSSHESIPVPIVNLETALRGRARPGPGAERVVARRRLRRRRQQERPPFLLSHQGGRVMVMALSEFRRRWRRRGCGRHPPLP